MSASQTLIAIQNRVHGYFTDAPIPDDENPKYTVVRITCETAKAHGITERDLNEWAFINYKEPSVGVVRAAHLVELVRRLRRPMGAIRFKARLNRDRRKYLITAKGEQEVSPNT